MCSGTMTANGKGNGSVDESSSTKNNRSDGGGGKQLAPSLVNSPPPRPPPTMLARYTCASLLVAVFAVWGKFTFVPESETPGVDVPMHSYKVPLCLTVGYLVSLPLLRMFVEKYLSKATDVKLLLKESMILYNVGQVLLNAWMVYRFIDALLNRGHPFIGDIYTVHTGTPYAIWVHYCDKYLEFFDTYFMVLRGNFHQVSFLHVYHHTTIAWAWWAGYGVYPGGDCYFGALLNSWIHVMMYSYYALSLLKISCPWKKYLTQAQLLQFASVVMYSFLAVRYYLPKDTTSIHYFAISLQVGEMVSLFVLFSHFYRKSYSKKRNATKKSTSEDGLATSTATSSPNNDDDDDQCKAAVKALTTTTNEIIGTAAKDANKLVTSAKKTMARTTLPVNKAQSGVF